MFQTATPIDLSGNPLETLYELGAGEDYRFFKMGRRDVFFVNAPDLIQWMFTNKAIRRGRFHKVFARWLGDGILASEGETHLAARRALVSAFNAEAQTFYMQTVQRDAPALLDEWDDGEMDLARALYMFVYNASIRAIYGLDKLTSRDTQQLLDVLAQGSEMFLGRAPLPEGHYFKESRIRHPVVDEALEYMWAHWRPTPLTRLLDTFPEQEKFDQTLTMLSASLDTSMAALVWMFHLLSQNPKAFAEFCDDARADVSTGYVTRALDETLRLYPTGGWLNTREIFQPLSIRGFDLPAGTNVFSSSWVTHRDARYFDSPDSFLPERFASPPAPWTYFPFGGGAHLCIGRPFSLVELPYLAALVVRTFDIEFLPRNTVQLRLRIGLTPEGEIPAKVRRRRG